MVSAALVNSRVNYGFIKVAAALGFPYQWYRPGTVAGAAIQPGNLLGTVTAYITTDASLKSLVPPSDATPYWFGAYDTTLTQPGDYLVGNLGTFFIGAEFLPAPASLVFCNVTFTLTRSQAQTPGPAFQFGGGLGNSVLATAFPGWIKAADRRQPAPLHLPGEPNMASSNVILPQSIPGQILREDVLVSNEALPRKFLVQSADLAFANWNLVVVDGGRAVSADTTAS